MGPKAAAEFMEMDAECIAFKPDGHLVSGDRSGYLRQREVGSRRNVTRQTMRSSFRVNVVTVSMDGARIVSGDWDNKVVVWDAVTHSMMRIISEHTDNIHAVDVSSDSTRIVSGSRDRTVRIFNINSGVRVIHPLQHDSVVVGVKFSPDGNRIATMSPDGSRGSTTARYAHVSVYDAHSGNELFDIDVPITWRVVTPLAWSSDGQQLFVASPGKITSFDTTTSCRSEWLIQKDNGRNSMSIVTHGRFIASASGSSISFWDYASRKQIGNLEHATPINYISISHDGRYLAYGHHQGITVYNLRDFFPRDYLRIPRVPRIPLVQVDDPVLESWMLGNTMNTESALSKEIAQFSDPSFHALAARSLIRARLREWKTALEDAEMSLQIQRSPIGQIARSIALVGARKQEIALNDFELAFCDCDPSDIMLLLVIKSIITFTCGNRKQAISHLCSLLNTADENAKVYYLQVLGNMYLEQRDYENAVQTLVLAKKPSKDSDPNPLMTISLIFNWSFDRLEHIACQRLCESLCNSGRMEEIGETLLKIVSTLAEDEKEPAHGRIIEEIVTHSGQVTLLGWTGKSSRCNSCLPCSPAVYNQQPLVFAPSPPRFGPVGLEKRTKELRAVFRLVDALVIYVRATSFQPVRFAHFRLHLPCIVFRIRSLRKVQENAYSAETAGLGNVEFTTADSLPLEEPQRLVFADLRIHGLLEPDDGSLATLGDGLEPDREWNSSDMRTRVADADAELMEAPIIEEAPSVPQLDIYTRALRLIAHLGLPFSALLLLRQSDGAYKRVAADHEIVVRGTGNNVPKDIRVEVLEIV